MWLKLHYFPIFWCGFVYTERVLLGKEEWFDSDRIFFLVFVFSFERPWGSLIRLILLGRVRIWVSIDVKEKITTLRNGSYQSS